jgi:hypothetical protein
MWLVKTCMWGVFVGHEWAVQTFHGQLGPSAWKRRLRRVGHSRHSDRLRPGGLRPLRLLTRSIAQDSWYPKSSPLSACCASSGLPIRGVRFWRLRSFQLFNISPLITACQHRVVCPHEQRPFGIVLSEEKSASTCKGLKLLLSRTALSLPKVCSSLLHELFNNEPSQPHSSNDSTA